MTSLDMQSAIMAAIVQASMVEIEGVKVARLDAGAIVDAFSIITAFLLASSQEAKTADGVRRLLRRHARQLERRMAELNRHTAKHGSPFEVAA